MGNPTIEDLREKFKYLSCDTAYIVGLFSEEIDKLKQDKARLFEALKIAYVHLNRNDCLNIDGTCGECNGCDHKVYIQQTIGEMEAEG